MKANDPRQNFKIYERTLTEADRPAQLRKQKYSHTSVLRKQGRAASTMKWEAKKLAKVKEIEQYAEDNCITIAQAMIIFM